TFRSDYRYSHGLVLSSASHRFGALTQKMELGYCAICGKAEGHFLFTGKDRWCHLPGFFQVFQCSSCASYFISPRLSPFELRDYYPEYYCPYLEPQQGRLRRIKENLGTWKQIRLVKKYKRKPGKALDVGCGNGAFLLALKNAGWQVWGTEINPTVSERLRSKGIDVILGDLSEIDFADQKFDLITFWDVLEHLPSPRMALQVAAKLASPEGFLIISIPNPESLEATLFGPYWAGWDIPRHLWLAPIPVVSQILEEAGWSIRSIVYGRGRLWLFRLSLYFWMEEHRSLRFLLKPTLSFLSLFVADLMFWPFFTLIGLLKRGSVAIFVAQIKGATHVGNL
ncbi:MAG: class I SAM-dependent methyltransferase, partial [Anaerolineae bacterium]